MKRIEHRRPLASSAPFTYYIYTYDKANRIKTQNTSHDTLMPVFSQAGSGILEIFDYDQAGQLIDLDSHGGGQDESFDYDQNGNREDSTANGVTDVGPYNRLLSDAGSPYTYDNEGNLLTREDADNLGWTYEYDHRNRLVEAQKFDDADISTHTLTFRYNADNQLVARRYEHRNSVGTLVNSQENHYVHDGSQLALSLDQNGDVEHRYTWGPGVDQLLADEAFDSTGDVEDTLWAAGDHLGTVRQLLDGTGDVVEHREFSSFGELDAIYNELGNAKISLASDIAYTGKYRDPISGLQNSNARWYDPPTGRFLGEDPAEEGSNWYRYAGNDPINFRDPTGLSQAGNPLNNLFGGYSTNRVQPNKVFVDAPYGLASNAVQSANAGLFGPVNRPAAAPSFSLANVVTSPTEQRYQNQIDQLSRQTTALRAQIATANRTARPGLQSQLDLALGQRAIAVSNLNAAIDGTGQTFAYDPNGTRYVSVGDAIQSGLKTGGKAVGNSLGSSLSLGVYDGPFEVTRQDIANGYNASRFIAGVSTELLVGLGTGGLAGTGSTIGRTALALDTASNALGAGRGAIDAYNNGLTVGNTLQIAGGAFGLAGNVATGGRALQELASDASRLRVSFDPATLSTGGLGGARVYLAPKPPLGVGQGGRFADLERLAVVGDDLTPHHIPQAALGFTSRADGGALVLPQSVHQLTRTYGFRGAQLAAEESGLGFRTVIARDIRDVRSLTGRTYNTGIQNLLQYYRESFPQLLTK